MKSISGTPRREPRNRATIFLAGFMGAGKSTVGRLLADRMGCTFIDLDLEVEHRAGRTIAEIFADLGEDEFRRMELAALEASCARGAAVVATGGGAMSQPAMRDIMQAHGIIVWLDPPFEVLADRVGAAQSDPGAGADAGSARPLFTTIESARKLWMARQSDYHQADVRIPVRGDESATDLAAQVARRLEEAH